MTPIFYSSLPSASDEVAVPPLPMRDVVKSLSLDELVTIAVVVVVFAAAVPQLPHAPAT